MSGPDTDADPDAIVTSIAKVQYGTTGFCLKETKEHERPRIFALDDIFARFTWQTRRGHVS